MFWAVCLGLFVWGSSDNVQAQAWTKKQGEVYLKIAYALATASEQFNFEGGKGPFYTEKPGYTFADSSIFFYAEGGITDYLTMIASLPYKRLYNETVDHRKLTVGTGDLWVKLRFSIQEFAKIPIISALSVNLGASLPMNYTRNRLPTLGRGQVELRATLDYGQSFYPMPAYFQMGVGYNTRLPFYALTQAAPCKQGGDIDCIVDQPDSVEGAHEFIFYAEFGVTPIGWLLMQFRINGTISFANPTATLVPPGEIPPATQRFIQAGTMLVFFPFYKLRSPWIKKLGFSAQFTGTLWGQNTINAGYMFFGLEYQINFKSLGQ